MQLRVFSEDDSKKAARVSGVAIMAERVKQLKVWLLFSKVDGDDAHCHKCNQSLKCIGWGETQASLKKHFKNVLLASQKDTSRVARHHFSGTLNCLLTT